MSKISDIFNIFENIAIFSIPVCRCWQVLGSVCLMMRMSQLAVYHADGLTPLDVHDDLDDFVDAPLADDVTSPTHFRSRVSKHDGDG